MPLAAAGGPLTILSGLPSAAVGAVLTLILFGKELNVYAFFGLVMNVAFGWNTALAFGVTGVLWAIGPMIATLREMLGGRIEPSVVLATILGGLTLFGWAFLGT